jgi:hypothetical protein
MPPRVVPDFLRRREAVTLRIGRVVELLGHNRIGYGREKFLRFRYGSLHPELGRRQDELGPEKCKHLPPLDRHRFRHNEDQAIAVCCGYKGKRNASVARGRLNQNAFSGLDQSRLLHRLDLEDADTVFHASYRIEEFKPCEQISPGPVHARNLVKPHERRISGRIGYRSIDAALPGKRFFS